MRSRVLLALVVLVVALAGCDDGGDDGVRTFDDPRGTLEVSAGEEFRVLLAENPSTGYRWRFLERPVARVVRPAGDEFELEEGGEDRAGAGGTRVLTFDAVAPGTTRIVLGLFGPSRGARATETRRLRVTVGG